MLPSLNKGFIIIIIIIIIGGDLVSISNEKEMKFVHDMAFKDANRTSVWIGLAYRHRKGGYVWNNGESFMKINASKS